MTLNYTRVDYKGKLPLAVMHHVINFQVFIFKISQHLCPYLSEDNLSGHDLVFQTSSEKLIASSRILQIRLTIVQRYIG